jgi:hypothetical protein
MLLLKRLADGLSSVPAACRLDRMTGGVNACVAGSRMLRDSIRCSTQMLRQMQVGVKLQQRQYYYGSAEQISRFGLAVIA